MQFQHNFVKTVKDMRVTSKTIPHTIFDYPNFDEERMLRSFTMMHFCITGVKLQLRVSCICSTVYLY